MSNEQNNTVMNTDFTGLELIKTLPISPIDAYILLRDLLDSCHGRGKLITRAKECIRLGADALKSRNKSVSFMQAVQSSLQARRHRRKRTLQEIRYIIGRMVKLCPDLRNKQGRNITGADCRRWLNQCFKSPRQWGKGRIILSAVLNHAKKQGWCDHNEASRLDSPVLYERRIPPLSLYEIRRLLLSAAELYGGECLPACALMLYAGIRPQEVRRLTWDCINLKEGMVNIESTHSKTGGCRQVSICLFLKKLLRRAAPLHRKKTPICPSNWENKWRKVRRHSGILKKTGWIQNVLRHTYASYHQAYFKDRKRLEQEMGHSNSTLLNTRYLNMERLTPGTSEKFWCNRDTF